MFKNTVAPVLKRGAKTLAKEALSTGLGVASDMLEGGSGRESLERRGKVAARRLGRRGVKKLQGMLDEPRTGSKRIKGK